ncbi:MAG: hypothetical protein JWS12_502 [Candidatus Saccharibacteria bacterium]|nr:hypothetical protein [Candidatus Saccharibacteria bacterium]
MSESFSDTREPSTPQQAQQIVDLVEILEDRDADDEHNRWFKVTVEELPELLESKFPPGVVAGNSRSPLTFNIYDSEADAHEKLKQVAKPTEWRWADSQKSEDVSSCFYDVRAEHDLYREDPDLWPFLEYQQVAGVILTQHKLFNNLPVELTTQIEYSVWQAKDGAMFIHRGVHPEVNMTVEGRLMWEEGYRQHGLDIEIEHMEKGEDSRLAKLAKFMQFMKEYRMGERSQDEASTEDGDTQEAELDRQAFLERQNHMLEVRSMGEGVVDISEALSLIGLLEKLKKVA